MKGTFFQKPLELKLNVEGEVWNQGDPIVGTLTVKNHGNEAVSLQSLHVDLAYADFKKVRQKAPDAFEILSTVPAPGGTVQLASQQELSFPWRFDTDRNCPITDNLSSLFIVYGEGSASEKLGQIQLPIHPDILIQEFLKTLQIDFRFVTKTQKSNSKGVEVKLAPPSAKAFATLDNLVLSFQFEGDNLEVKYTFNVKKVEASAAAFDLKKQKKTLEQSFTPDQYRTPSGRWNHDSLKTAIQEALGVVESKILFS